MNNKETTHTNSVKKSLTKDQMIRELAKGRQAKLFSSGFSKRHLDTQHIRQDGDLINKHNGPTYKGN